MTLDQQPECCDYYGRSPAEAVGGTSHDSHDSVLFLERSHSNSFQESTEKHFIQFSNNIDRNKRPNPLHIPTSTMPRPRRPPPPSRSPEPTIAPSALAKKLCISASTEAEIRSAFALFATEPPDLLNPVLPSTSFSRALAALGCAPNTKRETRELLDAVDPESSGEISYEDFVAVAALQLQSRDDDEVGEEVESAFKLFLEAGEEKGKGDKGRERITVSGLRRVAKALGQDIKEEVLRDMVMEANGMGPEGIGKGVGREDFVGVMRRSGMLR